jgi:hypothetical protein
MYHLEKYEEVKFLGKYPWLPYSVQHSSQFVACHNLRALSDKTLKYLYLLYRLDFACLIQTINGNKVAYLQAPTYETFVSAINNEYLDCRYDCPNDNLRETIYEAIEGEIENNFIFDKKLTIALSDESLHTVISDIISDITECLEPP